MVIMDKHDIKTSFRQNIYLSDLDGDIDDTIKYFQDIKQKAREYAIENKFKIKSIYLNYTLDYSSYDYSADSELIAEMYREETNEEFKIRMKEIEDKKSHSEEKKKEDLRVKEIKERELYESLKLKYGV